MIQSSYFISLFYCIVVMVYIYTSSPHVSHLTFSFFILNKIEAGLRGRSTAICHWQESKKIFWIVEEVFLPLLNNIPNTLSMHTLSSTCYRCPDTGFQGLTHWLILTMPIAIEISAEKSLIQAQMKEIRLSFGAFFWAELNEMKWMKAIAAELYLLFVHSYQYQDKDGDENKGVFSCTRTLWS